MAAKRIRGDGAGSLMRCVSRHLEAAHASQPETIANRSWAPDNASIRHTGEGTSTKHIDPPAAVARR
jgi:hypothetical protein